MLGTKFQRHHQRAAVGLGEAVCALGGAAGAAAVCFVGLLVIWCCCMSHRLHSMPTRQMEAFYGTAHVHTLSTAFHPALRFAVECSLHFGMPVCPPLQSELTTVLIDIKQSVVHGCFVGVIYHVLCGRADRQVRMQLPEGRPWCSAICPRACLCALRRQGTIRHAHSWAGMQPTAGSWPSLADSCAAEPHASHGFDICLPCAAHAVQAAELRAVAIFQVDPATRQIVGSDAVVRVVSGTAEPEDECLPILMPA